MNSDLQLPLGDGVVAVICQDDRYLLIQRAAGVSANGKWCFVGGRVEPPESFEAALVREVREEVGLDVRPLELVWQSTSPNGVWRLHFWTTTLLDTQITPDPAEVADYRWLTPAQLSVWPDLLPGVHGYLRSCGELQ